MTGPLRLLVALAALVSIVAVAADAVATLGLPALAGPLLAGIGCGTVGWIAGRGWLAVADALYGADDHLDALARIGADPPVYPSADRRTAAAWARALEPVPRRRRPARSDAMQIAHGRAPDGKPWARFRDRYGRWCDLPVDDTATGYEVRFDRNETP